MQIRDFSRRRFLRALGQGTLLAALPSALLAEQGDVVTVSILHTTDLHGHILPTVDYDNHPDLGGMARCITQIRQWQRENPNWALIDVGDVYQGTEAGPGDARLAHDPAFQRAALRTPGSSAITNSTGASTRWPTR